MFTKVSCFSANRKKEIFYCVFLLFIVEYGSPSGTLVTQAQKIDSTAHRSSRRRRGARDDDESADSGSLDNAVQELLRCVTPYPSNAVIKSNVVVVVVGVVVDSTPSKLRSPRGSPAPAAPAPKPSGMVASASARPAIRAPSPRAVRTASGDVFFVRCFFEKIHKICFFCS